MIMIGAITLLFAAALLGGGAVFATRAQGYDLAQSAARAGAQCVDTTAYRDEGVLRLDQEAARTAVEQILAAASATGTIRFTAIGIEVTATSRQATPMLKAFGVSDIEVTATAQATPTITPPA
jgi:uncharacterized protein (DUF849 family)